MWFFSSLINNLSTSCGRFHLQIIFISVLVHNVDNLWFTVEDGGEELDIPDDYGIVPLVLGDIGEVVLVDEDEVFLP